MRDPFQYKTDDLTLAESREHKQLQMQTDRIWRDFWIRVFKRKGYSNVEIAKEMELSESSVRSILSKGRS